MSGIFNGECRFFLQISVQKVAHMCKRLYYCSMNDEQKQKTMKIEAQNLTVGMDIKWGPIGYKITKLENTTFKNGKPAIEVFGSR